MKKKNNILLSASLFGAPQYCKTFVFFLLFCDRNKKKHWKKNGTIWRPSLQYMRPYPVGLTFSTKKKKIQFHFYSVFAHSVVGWSRQLTILWRNLSFIDCKNLARGWQKRYRLICLFIGERARAIKRSDDGDCDLCHPTVHLSLRLSCLSSNR